MPSMDKVECGGRETGTGSGDDGGEDSKRGSDVTSDWTGRPCAVGAGCTIGVFRLSFRVELRNLYALVGAVIFGGTVMVSADMLADGMVNGRLLAAAL